jgi:hypothetical protein
VHIGIRLNKHNLACMMIVSWRNCLYLMILAPVCLLSVYNFQEQTSRTVCVQWWSMGQLWTNHRQGIYTHLMSYHNTNQSLHVIYHDIISSNISDMSNVVTLFCYKTLFNCIIMYMYMYNEYFLCL